MTTVLLAGCAEDQTTTTEPQVVATFQGNYSAANKTVEIAFTNPDGTPIQDEPVFAPAVGPVFLPFGNTAGHIFMHTAGGTYNPVGAGGELDAFIQARCVAGPNFGHLTQVTVFLNATSDAPNTFPADPLTSLAVTSYNMTPAARPTITCGTATSGGGATVTWRFVQTASSPDFTFTGTVKGVAAP